MSHERAQRPDDDKLVELVDIIRTNLRVRQDSDVVYVDFDGNLAAVSRQQHQVVFGRRGSGKSTLLLALQRSAQGQPDAHAVYVNAKSVKRGEYADVVTRIVLDLLRSMPTPPRRSSKLWWHLIAELEKLLDEQDSQQVTEERGESRATKASGRLAVSKVGLDGTQSAESSTKTTSTYTTGKREHLERRLPDFSAEISRALQMASLDHAALLLDDFYLLDPAIQPDVIDYLYRMLSGTKCYLKIGTVKNRTKLSRLDRVVIGVNVGQDVESLNLDLTLEHPGRAQSRLATILDTLAGQVGLTDFTSSCVAEAGLSLLVLASGGVARDFLDLVSTSVELWSAGESSTLGESVVLDAVSDYWSTTKLPVLRSELDAETAASAELIYTDLRRFCIQDLDSPVFGLLSADVLSVDSVMAAIEELVNLRLIHVLNRDARIADRDADVSLYLMDLSAFNRIAERLDDSLVRELLNGRVPDQINVSHVYALSHAQIAVAALVDQQDEDLDQSSPPVLPYRGKVEPADATPEPLRRRLPKERLSRTTSFSVGGAEGYMVAGQFEDGELGEIMLKLGKQGSTLAGVMDALSITTSIALQYGVPLETLVMKMTNLRFEPAGLTDDPDIRMAQSVMDYVYRRLALNHLPFETRSALGIYSAVERQRHLETGRYDLPDDPSTPSTNSHPQD